MTHVNSSVLSEWCHERPILLALTQCRNYLGREIGEEMGQNNRLVSDTGIVTLSPILQPHHFGYMLSVVCFSLRMSHGVIHLPSE